MQRSEGSSNAPAKPATSPMQPPVRTKMPPPLRPRARAKQETPATPEVANLRRLEIIVRKVHDGGARSLSLEELDELPKLYRYGASVVARLETSGTDASTLARAHQLVARAHGVLYSLKGRSRGNVLGRALRFLMIESPRAIRAEWRILSLSFGIFYGLVVLSYVAVSRDLELAYSLLSPEMVNNEIAQLQATETGEPFRGNFTFGLGESPSAATMIMLHNMGVGTMFFGSGIFPPFFMFLVGVNGLMVGTYTAVAGHWGQAGAISSILWCHGMLELQAFVIAGAAGMILARGWLAPGPWSRSYSLRLAGARAWRLAAPVYPILFISGLIEGFVSPHAPFGVRVATAIGTGVLLLAWMLLGGRGHEPAPST